MQTIEPGIKCVTPIVCLISVCLIFFCEPKTSQRSDATLVQVAGIIFNFTTDLQ